MTSPTDDLDKLNPVERCIKLADGQVPLAARVGVTQQFISKCKRKGRVPRKRAEAFSAAVNGLVSADELKGDR